MTAPRLRMTRRSPSRTSTVFRSFAAMSLTICSRRLTSIGLPVATVSGVELFTLRFGFFSNNVTALRGPVQRRQDFASGVRDQHIIFDAYAAFAGEVDSRLHRDDHS